MIFNNFGDEGKYMEKDIRGTVLNAVSFIEYQDGSVVSREIIRKETGTVTIFAFYKGEGLSEHTAPFDALVQVVDGEAEIIIAGKKNHLVKDEMIIMPAGQTHALNAPEKFKMILTMIRS